MGFALWKRQKDSGNVRRSFLLLVKFCTCVTARDKQYWHYVAGMISGFQWGGPLCLHPFRQLFLQSLWFCVMLIIEPLVNKNNLLFLSTSKQCLTRGTTPPALMFVQ